jgi:hypothetical protein
MRQHELASTVGCALCCMCRHAFTVTHWLVRAEDEDKASSDGARCSCESVIVLGGHTATTAHSHSSKGTRQYQDSGSWLCVGFVCTQQTSTTRTGPAVYQHHSGFSGGCRCQSIWELRWVDDSYWVVHWCMCPACGAHHRRRPSRLHPPAPGTYHENCSFSAMQVPKLHLPCPLHPW